MWIEVVITSFFIVYRFQIIYIQIKLTIEKNVKKRYTIKQRRGINNGKLRNRKKIYYT